MVRLPGGLIITEALTQNKVSVDMHFEPSVGILARKLDTLGLSIQSMREPLKRSVQKVVIPSIRTNFDVGGRPPWRDLSAKTVTKKHGDARILIRTGALRRQMGYLNTWTIDSEKAMITDLPDKVWYGKVHQKGWGGTQEFTVKNISTGEEETFTEEGEGGIPARPFVMLQPEDINDIEREFDDWLGEKIAAAGLGPSTASVL